MTLGLILSAAAWFQPPPAAACPIIENWTIIGFDNGSAELSGQARAQLDNWSEVIRGQHFPAQVQLTGGADRVGARPANLRLSFRLAYAVRDFLAGRGVSRRAVSIRAFGEDRQLVDTPDGVPEPQNRIVQLLMIPDPREPRPC